MSATLTWYSSGNGAKTGTAVANFFDDLDTLVTSKSGDANFKWEKAGKNSGSTPYYLLLRRKDGSAGRIGIICWTSGPAANNTAILDTSPTANQIYITWFPAGTGTTMSNLTAASGTICGNDTGAVKCAPSSSLSASYGASVVHFYFDCTEGMVFGSQNPAAATIYMFGAGDLVIDAADAVYGCTFGMGTSSANSFGGTAAPMAYSASTINAGSTTPQVRTNYGSSNRVYFFAWAPSGTWASVAVSSTDILTDTSNSKVWFVPCQLLGQTKGEGFVLKFRQIAFGPGTLGPYTPYNTTGPVVQARQFCNQTAGANGPPWLTNFKL